MPRRFRFCGLLTLMALVVGCQAKTIPKSAPNATASSLMKPVDPAAAKATWDLPDTDTPNNKPTITEPRPTAEALKHKAEEYAKQMDAMLARRAGGNNAQIASASAHPTARPPAKSDNAVQPSGVKFNDPPHAQPEVDPNVPAANPAPPPSAEAPSPGGAPVASITPTDPAVTPAVPSVTQTPPRAEMPFNKDTPAVNTPLIVGQPRPLPSTDDLAQKISQQVKDYPRDPTAHLDWQLFQFLQGQSVPQLQSLSTLPGEDREILTALFDGLTNFRNALRADDNMLLSRKIKPLLEVGDRLRSQAELTVPIVALCTDVKGFGVYEPIDPARFEAGKDHRVIVYCEVENFASLIDEQKRWETKLSQEVVLYTEQNGLEVWRDKSPMHPIVDYSRNRRHDFFIVKMIHLPANLTIGRYLLKVTVIDQQVNRVAENTAAIQIVAQ